MLLSINQSKVGGSPNKAKPLLMLCIIDCIEEESVIDNKILFDVIAQKYKYHLSQMTGTIAREYWSDLPVIIPPEQCSGEAYSTVPTKPWVTCGREEDVVIPKSTR